MPPVKPGDVVGHFVAINPLTGEKKWEVPLTDLPSSAGMLATGGGLVFTGKLTGRVRRARRGHRQDAVAVQDRLERQCDGDHLHAQGPAVRDHRVGTAAAALASRYAADKVPTGGSVWTFALMPD